MFLKKYYRSNYICYSTKFHHFKDQRMKCIICYLYAIFDTELAFLTFHKETAIDSLFRQAVTIYHKMIDSLNLTFFSCLQNSMKRNFTKQNK